MKGIDVSENNGSVDWQAVADAGIEFVMIRSSYGLHSKDEMFTEHYNGAKAAGLKVGAYHYSYALTPDDAIEEAKNCSEAIDGFDLDLPVFFDMEDADGYKAKHEFDFSGENVTAICKQFINNLGVDCGIYASYDWLTEKINWRSLGCAVWNAEWGNVDDIKGYMWQFTDHYSDDLPYDGNIYYEV